MEDLFNSSKNFGGLKGKGKKKAWLDVKFCVQKVKLSLNDNPNIFSEIIELQENGAVEVFRLKLLTDPFTLG